MNEAANDIMKGYSTNYLVLNDELTKIFAYAKGEADGKCRTFATPVDYVIQLDRYLNSLQGQTLDKPFVDKEGVQGVIKFDKPVLFVSFLSFIGHTAKKWDKAKESGEAFQAVLEDTEQYFCADGTEKAIVGIYQKEVALKVLPIVLKENEDKANKVELNISVNGCSIELG